VVSEACSLGMLVRQCKIDTCLSLRRVSGVERGGYRF